MEMRSILRERLKNTSLKRKQKCADADVHLRSQRYACEWNQSLVEARPDRLSIRIHQWRREGGAQAFRLQQSTFSLCLPPFHPLFWLALAPHPHCQPSPIISHSSLTPPLPPTNISVSVLRTPPPPEGSLFNRDKNSELPGP